MTQYICKLPIPLKQEQVKFGGEWQHKDIDTLYFKEPSVAKLQCDFRYTRSAYKAIQNAIERPNKNTEEGKKTQKKESAEEDDFLKNIGSDYEKASKRGYQMLELIDSADIELQDNFFRAFEVFLTKGSCFTTPQMENDNCIKQTTIELLEYANREEIFAMYIGFFLDFFILKNPEKMKKYIVSKTV